MHKQSLYYSSIITVDEQDVIELERRYWVLRSAVLKFDLNVFTSIVSPPVPATLCSGEPTVLDELPCAVKLLRFSHCLSMNN